MSLRRRLPDRRPCETFEFETGGRKYVCSVGRFADGTVGEIFLTNHRVNSQAGIMASDQAVLASQALQHGASLGTLSRAVMRDAQGRATSPIGCAFDLILGAQP
jgi:ribonucleoside-diphosphate reductase alpha chain